MKPLFRTFAVLALTVFPALAQPAPRRGDGRMGRALALTDAQKTSIQAIRERRRPDLAAQRDAVREAQAAFRAALRDPATPEAQLRLLHDKAASARFGMLMAGRAMRQDIQAVLTPEQRTKAAQLREEARFRRQERLRHFRMAMDRQGCR
ncbi:Spy/CpxP family protein refolding chaperone [Geothrix terrae]|uniref:Spy/CpxP family protein refolding chaperone n=1 Tax=Geothrix terrae TaxID=2922720 RepID=UPI001FAC1084|nr:Spy/CpxP family protein refolding chaperone [Geothrix terrae]